MSRIGINKQVPQEKKVEEPIITMENLKEEVGEGVQLVMKYHRFDELSAKYRLSFDEYVETVNEFIESEKDDWTSMRLKDQINLTTEALMIKTMLKYAEKEYGLKTDQYQGRDIVSTPRFDHKEKYVGDDITLMLVKIQSIGMY